MLSDFRGTETEHRRHCARHRRASRGAKPGAAQCRYLWHRRGRRAGAAAVDRCGGRHRQNQDAGAPGGAADPRRRRPAPFVAADLYPPRRARNDPPRPADPRCEPTWSRPVAAPRPRCCRGRAHFIRSATGCCAGTPTALSLDPAFTVLDRADSADLMDLVRSDLGLARTRSRFPKKGTCLAIYSYTVNAGWPLEETLADSYPWCDEWEAELKRLFPPMSPPSSATTSSITTICCCIGARPSKYTASPRRCGRISTISWLTSIRTPTGCKPRSCSRWRPMVPGSPWSATMPSRSMPFVPRRCETSSIFPTSSHRGRRSFRSNTTIVRPSQFSTLPTRSSPRAREGFSKTLTSSKPSAELPLVTVERRMAQAAYVADQVLEHREAGIDLRHQAFVPHLAP